MLLQAKTFCVRKSHCLRVTQEKLCSSQKRGQQNAWATEPCYLRSGSTGLQGSSSNHRKPSPAAPEYLPSNHLHQVRTSRASSAMVAYLLFFKCNIQDNLLVLVLLRDHRSPARSSSSTERMDIINERRNELSFFGVGTASAAEPELFSQVCAIAKSVAAWRRRLLQSRTRRGKPPPVQLRKTVSRKFAISVLSNL